MEPSLIRMLSTAADDAAAITAPGRPGLSYGSLRALVQRTLATLNGLGIGQVAAGCHARRDQSPPVGRGGGVFRSIGGGFVARPVLRDGAVTCSHGLRCPGYCY